MKPFVRISVTIVFLTLLILPVVGALLVINDGTEVIFPLRGGMNYSYC